jgi:hypothetical protein
MNSISKLIYLAHIQIENVVAEKRKNLPSFFTIQAALQKLFDNLDTDNSGTISFREIMVFCKKKGLRLGFGEIVAFMKYYDKVN